MIRAIVLGALGLGATACDRRPRITSCGDDLSGSWTGESGVWQLLDNGDTIEGYPMFADTPAASPEVVTAPRVLDLRRDPSGFGGAITRRYMRAAFACNTRATVHVTACGQDTLELVLGDPALPFITASGDCTPTRPPPTRRERWHRP